MDPPAQSYAATLPATTVFGDHHEPSRHHTVASKQVVPSLTLCRWELLHHSITVNSSTSYDKAKAKQRVGPTDKKQKKEAPQWHETTRSMQRASQPPTVDLEKQERMSG